MSSLRYTVCAYYPDLHRPQTSYPFAVLVAGEEEVALVGVNLSAYGITGENPFSQTVIDKTYEMMMRRLAEACACRAADTGLAILERFVADNQSNIQFQPIRDVQHMDRAITVALDLFTEEIEDHLSSPHTSEDSVPRALSRACPERRAKRRQPQLV